MKLTPGMVVKFTATFMIVFAVMLALYPYLIKVYDPAVLGTANWVMERMDPPTEMVQRKTAGGWRALNIDRGVKRGVALWLWWQPYLHYLSLALLPALLAATPAPWKTRLKLLALSAPLLFLVHVVTIVGIVRLQLCFVENPMNLQCKVMLRAVNTSGQLFTVLLWGLLTWRYWIPSRGGGEVAPQVETPPA